MGLLTDYYGNLGKLVAAPEPRVPTRDSQNALGRKQFDPNKASTAEAILGLSPVLGDVLSAKDTAASLSEGNYGEAALNGIGLLPFVPGLAGVVKKVAPLKLNKEAAQYLVSGMTEKPLGIDPIKFINADSYSLHDIPLSKFQWETLADGAADGAYDSTVNMNRALDYANRDGIFPPIIARESRNDPGLYHVIDGGHRITAARLRGDEFIKALTRNK